MYKEIKRVDPARGILQITTLNERFYAADEPHPVTGLPEMVFRPSVTWIASYYPKGRGFEKWLKKNGDEADEIAALAADRGYQVHRAIASLNAGETVHLSDVFEDQFGELREMTPDEYAGVMSYVDWWEAEGNSQYEILDYERTLWPDASASAEKYGIEAKYFRWAGTMDLKVRRLTDGAIGIIDMKTAIDIWPAHEIQLSAYSVAVGADFQAILQLNYRRNKKKKWKFTEIENKFSLFVSTMHIWEHETAGIEPLQRDFPLELRLKGIDPPKKKENAA
jgi:hypothetical protein